MKIKELLYKTPEMTEDKLLEIMDNELPQLRVINRYILNNLYYLREYKKKGIALTEYPNRSIESQCILKEFDLIQDKKSYLTKSQRDLITGFVGACMIKMAKGNVGTDSDNSGISTSSESTSQD